eukprot:TRINITY_DN28820_c0_g1_i1.p1 TRINITY_DN28820_c0_g1~~TRINITY_DN28820_c0_g1_i1.p1  ORF type:complete len:2516 (+),score=639.61 TRINITY_DN28820_c0_g1_i1:711-7550(+)
MCGGSDRNGIYSLVPLPPPFTPVWMGCFKDDGTIMVNKLPVLAYTDATGNTVEECTGVCQHNGYKYAGLQYGKECYCGDDITTSEAVGVSDCSYPCPGNASETCGGVDRNDIYALTNETSHPSPELVGCFQDDGVARTMPFEAFDDPAATITVCQDVCRHNNYTFAALQFGTQCWCGTTLPALRLGRGECDTPCGGDATMTCGGVMKNQIYSLAPMPPPSFTPVPVGCFVDDINNRIYPLVFQNNMTTANDCIGVCRHNGFNYSGLEFGDQCFCGNTVTPAIQTIMAECDMTCFGDSNQNCGGNTRLLVFEIVEQPAIAHDTPTLMGCFIDDIMDRKLPFLAFDNSNANSAACNDACRHNNYSFAGLQFGTQCYCGNTASTSVETADSECNMACSGNAAEWCGAGLRNTIWRLNNAFVDPLPNYQGCYYDDVNTRTLPVLAYNAPDNTNEMCIRVCRHNGYAFAGTQWSNECYCGNDISAILPASEGDCSSLCSGNSSEYCGGGARNTIWGAPSRAVPTNYFTGCYVDDANTGVLSHKDFSRYDATVELCLWSCQAGGYTYAALELGTDCWCGNSVSGQVTHHDQCNTPCGGNSAETCGASTRATVYSLSGPPATGTPELVGCFEDTPPARKIDMFSYSSTANTVEECTFVCFTNGFTYAALQAGSDCYCGNDISTSMQTAITDCQVPCTGNATEYCGGSSNNLVYSFAGLPTVKSSVFAGCFGSAATSAMPFSYSSTANTLEMCAAVCDHNGFDYYSLSAGSDCTCGNNITGLTRFGEGDCTVACSGNAGEICGDASKYSIYSFVALPVTPAYQDAGCFQGPPTATMTISYTSAANTIETCAAVCSQDGFDYFGLSGDTCACGSDISSVTMVATTDCAQPCSGNSSEICGDASKYSIYSFVSLATVRSSVRIGCFWVKPHFTMIYTSSANTREMCAAVCDHNGYDVYTLYNSDQCGCAADLGSLKLIGDSMCNLTASGDSSENGGGIAGNEVWSFTLSPPAAPGPIQYQGCLRNVNPVYLRFVSTNLTIDQCQAACAYTNIQYVILKNGDSCYCTGSFFASEWDQESVCDIDCNGDPSNKCGGVDAYTAYTFIGLVDPPSVIDYWGCFNDDAMSRTFEFYAGSSTTLNSVERCATICKHNNYTFLGLQNGEDCYCGNSTGSAQLTADTVCNMPCTGNSSEKCGGSLANSVYSTTGPSAPTPSSYFAGCFVEAGLMDFFYTSTATTQESCARSCFFASYNYYSLYNGNSCYCTNDISTSSMTHPAKCKMACSGDSSEYCGGSSTQRVYSFSTIPSVPTAELVGCFEDDISNRKLTGFYYTDTANTVEDCNAVCHHNGYDYYGVQYGSQCFCGNVTGFMASPRTSIDKCDNTCPGNSSEICGGGWKNSIYSFVGVPAEPTTYYAGCWETSTKFTSRFATNTKNSLPECARACAHGGYKYVGLTNANACYCANSLSTVSSSYEDQCNMACTDTTVGGICGGNAENSVYALAMADLPTFPSSEYVGCYQDSSTYRVLAGPRYSGSNYNTPEQCLKFCNTRGYSYFGVEYKSECYCGNSFNNTRTIEASCDRICTGSSDICGGAYRLSMYSTTGVPAPPTSSDYVGCFQSSSLKTVYSSTSNTISACAEVCWYRGYSYYGLYAGNDCKCGNTISDASRIYQAQCTMACGGDNALTCGGNAEDAIYSYVGLPAATPTPQHIGCYLDTMTRKFDFAYQHSSMNVEECSDVCYYNGYTYSAGQSSDQCFCGRDVNYVSSQRTHSGFCNFACTGNTAESCGSSYRNDVYSMVGVPTFPTRNYIGCFKDTFPVRKIDDFSWNISKNTVDECYMACYHNNFTYAATQFGTQCYCGNDISTSTRTSDVECNYVCDGDSSQNCGGVSRNAVYSNLPAPEVPTYYTVGCFIDDVNNRKMGNPIFINSAVDNEQCALACSHNGYDYFAIQAGDECYCGNSLTGVNRDVTTACSTPCAGNSSQMCGGYERLMVHTFLVLPSPPAPVYQGCYQDTSSPRKMDVLAFDSPGNSIDECTKVCLQNGYTYAAMQYSTQCFCGNDLSTSTRIYHGLCNYNCTNGDSCGGVLRNDVWSVVSVPAAVTPTYVDCRSDTSTRMFPTNAFTNVNAATVEECTAICQHNGFTYAGMQAGSECWCGNSYSGYAWNWDSYCNIPCTGNSAEMCGGVWKNSVYLLLATTPAPALTLTHEGCFDATTTSFPFMDFKASYLTVDKCTRECFNQQFTYAAMKRGVECWCGNTLSGTAMPSTSCTTMCSGGDGNTCGNTSPYRYDVYSMTV